MTSLPKVANHAHSLLDLTGRTAMITGGSRGMGRAMAQRFLEAGAETILVARRADVLETTRQELDRDFPEKVFAYSCDVSDRGQIASLCEKLRKDHPRIDILVNNAGSSNTGNFEEISDERWQEDLDLKLMSAIRLARFVLPGMKERGWGRILNVVSIIGKTPGPRGAPTNVSRAAGIALSKVLASEFAPYGVLVNALCTGRIESDQLERRWAAKNDGTTFEALKAEQAKPIPLGRIGEALEFANLALFLASDAASYVTGTAINVDGGLCTVV